MLNKVVFTPNVQVQVRLKYPDGKLDQNGRYGDQMFYTLEEPAESCMYLNTDVAAKLYELEPRKGEAIAICKRWTGKKTDSVVWDIWRPDQEAVQPHRNGPQMIRPDNVEADLRRSLEQIEQQRARQAEASLRPAPVAAALSKQPTVADTGNNGSSNGHAAAKSQTKLADALKTAVDAAHQATEYAKSIGYTTMPEFMGDDLRAMACTLIIQAGGR
jgi:hypothetical protein